MADTLSTAPTVAPEDSVSNTSPEPSKATAQGGRRAGARRSAKNVPAKDTPPGAVQVPKPGQNKTGKSSTPISATIPLTGWAELDLCASRVETIPTFTVDANPYADLVDAEYDRIVSRCPTVGKHIPYALFRYYCFQLFWYRVLFLQKSNGQTLTTEQKNFLSAFAGGEDYQIPNHIAQYLANMGNFTQAAEAYYFRLLEVSLSGKNEDAIVTEGWVDCGNGSTRITSGPQFWAYAQLPIPGVFTTAVTNEVAYNDPSGPSLNTLDHVTPVAPVGYSWLPTPNIVGWVTRHRLQGHTSWRSTYANLGWTDASIPSDVQTSYLFSPSSMRWMSDKLSSAKELKVHSSKQIALSTQGSPMQAYWLEEPDKLPNYDDPTYADDETDHKATAVLPLALTSRFSVDPKATTPAFNFGYRLERSKSLKGYDKRKPQFNERSNYQPWIYRKDGEDDTHAIADPPAQFLVGMNATWTFGSLPNVNVARFQTTVLRRDEALSKSLVLVE